MLLPSVTVQCVLCIIVNGRLRSIPYEQDARIRVMRHAIPGIFNGSAGNLWPEITDLYAVLVAANLGA
jgi:hypothetical protein